ncbi:hypothetical protein XIS1_740009 [Xenorhabdus innexi]|uniref:Uncharacterized protein n=1 Tax=Xenorhabdus innexi TaxID=290109 RepID=A0A1N6N0N2_9GAMM|nr:hypothetical protein XIS1_740009 [Xenorhabdus innexi]
MTNGLTLCITDMRKGALDATSALFETNIQPCEYLLNGHD